MKILVIPKQDVTFYDLFFNGKTWPKPKPRHLRRYINFDHVSYEYIYYSDLVLLKNSNVDILGNIHNAYIKPPSLVNTNPSGSNCPQVHAVGFREMWNKIKTYNIFILSSHTKKAMIEKIYFQKSRNSKVAIIEHEDHDQLSKNPDLREVCRGFEKNKHFDIYFKKDLPTDFKADFIFPLAPDPIRLSSFPDIKFKKFKTRDISVFFSGVINKQTTFEHRAILLNHLSEIKKSKIVLIDVDKHYSKKIEANAYLFENLQRSKFVICPPGRAWTTTRISMAAYFGNLPILCEPYVQLVNFDLIDGVNCILYPSLISKSDDEKRSVVLSLKKRLESILDDNEYLEKLAKNFQSHFLKKHSTRRRAAYIESKIKNLIYEKA